MGVVYKAEDTKLKRLVALKFLRADVLEDEEHKERFLREAQAAAALDHPNICTVYEIDEADGRTFLSMAYLEGETVKEKIKARPLKLEDALDIAIQTAQGLQAAHEKGVVHRDIKSANLMVTPQGQVKIMDFGLAQLAERSQLTKTATILGTPAYMSPEQAQRLPTDRRTDVWSLGVVVCEMVTGRLPFEGEREEAVAYSIVHEEPEPLTAQRVDVPIELDRIVGKAMAKSSAERYQHVDEMLVDFQALRKKHRGPAAGLGVGSPGQDGVQYAGDYRQHLDDGTGGGRTIEPERSSKLRCREIALPPTNACLRRFSESSKELQTPRLLRYHGFEPDSWREGLLPPGIWIHGRIGLSWSAGQSATTRSSPNSAGAGWEWCIRPKTPNLNDRSPEVSHRSTPRRRGSSGAVHPRGESRCCIGSPQRLYHPRSIKAQ